MTEMDSFDEATEDTEGVEQIEAGGSWYTVVRHNDEWTERTEVWDGDDHLFTMFNHLLDDETIRLCISAYGAGKQAGERYGQHQARADIRKALGL